MLIYAMLLIARSFCASRNNKPAPVRHKFADGNVDMMELPEHY